ncbi:hypothetical protein [Microvirga sp. VF16]|uniref:hypothetical protein n=1 Tax=Microvirga sp. VF16 TaxID=2807101 RepID=UPI00193C99C2|nr:hypothetical protein [Microvirga sp. VF16]QRM35965.1 hypothetical protein JO965_47180 [Microvirga sp. VF16]
MTRLRAILMAAILFGGVCLVLGALGAMIIESGRVLGIYGMAVLGFAAWVSWDTFQGCRAGQGAPRSRRSLP